jgi:hypothetical protein
MSYYFELVRRTMQRPFHLPTAKRRYRLEMTVRNQLDWTLNEFDAMGVLVDEEAEKFVVQHFNMMTSMSMPIRFPPGVTATMDVPAHQGSHARARMRLNNQLQREAASAIRSLKLRAQTPQFQPW